MKKILVIDDELSVRWAVRLSLKTHGYTILEAASGEEGLAKAKAEQPDLILSDVHMGGIDGFEVLKNLRAHSETSAIPVILMTGVPEKADVRFGMEQGADDYLAKPFGNETLLAAVKARLDRQQLLQAQSTANESRLLELLSATHDLIAIADPQNGLLLYLNSAGRKTLGLDADDNISGLQLSDITAETGSGMTLRQKVDRVLRDRIWVGEGLFIARDGRRIPVSEQIMAHNASTARGAFLSIVARDISDRKRAEAELEKAHRELLEASRQAGMAEVATGVLHNVGNVLNSVNVASACMAENLRNSKAATLTKVLNLLQEHESDLANFLSLDPKGKQIPGYLMQVSEHLMKEQETALNELAQLQKGIEHIKDIVTAQQNYGKVSGAVETITVADLVEDTLKMTSSAFTRPDVQIAKELGQDLAVSVEKHKVMQILVNLVRNARQACDATEQPEKKLTIRASNTNDRVRISVSDNGVGIPPENLDRIFTLGFTTKKNGHGFGLHSSALAAKELGGVLLVESNGAGQGATFTLELPA